MRAGEPVTRSQVVTCRRCGRTWEVASAVGAAHDPGGDREALARTGAPAATPWPQITCAACGGRRRLVSTLPLVALRRPEPPAA